VCKPRGADDAETPFRIVKEPAADTLRDFCSQSRQLCLAGIPSGLYWVMDGWTLWPRPIKGEFAQNCWAQYDPWHASTPFVGFSVGFSDFMANQKIWLVKMMMSCGV
jgi:hypothetical protein